MNQRKHKHTTNDPSNFTLFQIFSLQWFSPGHPVDKELQGLPHGKTQILPPPVLIISKTLDYWDNPDRQQTSLVSSLLLQLPQNSLASPL